MPIYAYRCAACSHAKDVLQKISDPLLTVCPACGAETFQKQVTAAGFQLKGSGWYVTDFRDGAKSAPAADKPSGDAKPAGGALAGHAEAPGSKDAAGKAGGARAPAPAASTAAPAPSAPTGGAAPAPSSSSN